LGEGNTAGPQTIVQKNKRKKNWNRRQRFKNEVPIDPDSQQGKERKREKTENLAEVARWRHHAPDLQGSGVQVLCRTSAPSYHCPVCQLDVTGQDFLAHMHGNKHLEKVAELTSGCWLCNIKDLDVDDAHFKGKKHTKAMARVKAFGVDTAQMGAHGRIQLKGEPEVGARRLRSFSQQ
jgi:hypothetical protein